MEDDESKYVKREGFTDAIDALENLSSVLFGKSKAPKAKNQHSMNKPDDTTISWMSQRAFSDESYGFSQLFNDNNVENDNEDDDSNVTSSDSEDEIDLGYVTFTHITAHSDEEVEIEEAEEREEEGKSAWKSAWEKEREEEWEREREREREREEEGERFEDATALLDSVKEISDLPLVYDPKFEQQTTRSSRISPQGALAALTSIALMLSLAFLLSPSISRNAGDPSQTNGIFLSQLGVIDSYYISSRIFAIANVVMQAIMVYMSFGIHIACRPSFEIETTDGNDNDSSTLNDASTASASSTFKKESLVRFKKTMNVLEHFLFPWIESSLLFRYKLWSIMGNLLWTTGLLAGISMLFFFTSYSCYNITNEDPFLLQAEFLKVSSSQCFISWGSGMALATCFFDFASFIVVNVTDKLFYSLLIDEVIEINQKNLRETDKELEKVLTANARHLVIQEGAEGFDIIDILSIVKSTEEDDAATIVSKLEDVEMGLHERSMIDVFSSRLRNLKKALKRRMQPFSRENQAKIARARRETIAQVDDSNNKGAINREISTEMRTREKKSWGNGFMHTLKSFTSFSIKSKVSRRREESTGVIHANKNIPNRSFGPPHQLRGSKMDIESGISSIGMEGEGVRIEASGNRLLSRRKSVDNEILSTIEDILSKERLLRRTKKKNEREEGGVRERCLQKETIWEGSIQEGRLREGSVGKARSMGERTSSIDWRNLIKWRSVDSREERKCTEARITSNAETKMMSTTNAIRRKINQIKAAEKAQRKARRREAAKRKRKSLRVVEEEDEQV